MRSEICIGDRALGPGNPTYVIAEIGINHGGNPTLAHRLIDAAADAGADAVKFQTFRADALMVPTRDRLAQQGDGSESAFEMFRRMELRRDDHVRLKEHAEKRGLAFLSTPFDEESADFLDRIGVPAFKVASGDITHFPLLRRLAGKGKAVLLSTGMSYLREVGDAVSALKEAGCREMLLLHCVSLYPTPPHDTNLRAITTLHEQFKLPVGFSDHSQGAALSLAAVVLGASAIERHFTLDKSAAGPDHKLSLDPPELRSLVNEIRSMERALGDGRKRPADGETESRLLSRRSVVAAVDIRALEPIEPWMIAFKRPSGGLEPRCADRIVGSKAMRNIAKDSMIRWEDLGSPAEPHPAAEDHAAIPLHGCAAWNQSIAAGK